MDNVLGSCSGSRGFVIGGGYSIKRYCEEGFDFSFLNSEVTVGANKAYKICGIDYLVFRDPWFWKNFSEEILSLDSVVLSPDNIFRDRKDNVYKFSLTSNYLPKSFDYIRSSNNSGVIALRVAYLLGVNPIYLVGIDLIKSNFERRLINFHDDYGEKRTKAVKPKRCDEFAKEFVATIKLMRKEGFDIYSTCEGSVLNKTIPYISLFDIF